MIYIDTIDTNLQDAILKAFDTVAIQRVKDFLKTTNALCLVSGIVTAVSTSTATVTINGDSFEVKIKSGLTISVGNIVNIIYPYGYWENAYIDSTR